LSVDDDRALIDRETRYPMEGYRIVERNAQRVVDVSRGATVERTRDVLQIEWGGENGVVLLVTAEALELRLPTIEWAKGACGPAPASRLWRRVAWAEIDDERCLREWIQKAQQARRRQYQKCRYCGDSFPPERRIGNDVCHQRAEAHEEVVY
jgi:hypothetical protein